MTMRRLLAWGIVAAMSGAGCTISQVEAPALTGPSTYGTSVTVTANPEIVTLGQFATTPGQQSQIIVSVFDATGQPKPNQLVRLDTVVNGQLSDCGELSAGSLTTASDGRATALFTAPGTPPNCPSFNSDGTVTIRATPIGSGASATAASSVNVFMALPTLNSSGGAVIASFSISQIAGVRNFLFDGTSSVSPGHSIIAYRWTFSDGHTEIGAIVDHDFSSAGTYFVTLTITDDIGQSSFKTALVTVN